MADEGCPSAAVDDELFASVYAQLRKLARRHMAGERQGHTLQVTALISEAFLRLRHDLASARDAPERFYYAAAEAMRRILIDHARSRKSRRRGGDLSKVALDLVEVANVANLDQILVVNQAIDALAEESRRSADIVRLRFFAGLSEEEVARLARLSIRTVRREWVFARAWLYRRLEADFGW